MTFRNQWSGFLDGGGPKTQILSYHTEPLRKVGLGGTIFNDKTGGALSFYGFQLCPSYHLDFKEGLLSLGISGNQPTGIKIKGNVVIDDNENLTVDGYAVIGADATVADDLFVGDNTSIGLKLLVGDGTADSTISIKKANNKLLFNKNRIMN